MQKIPKGKEAFIIALFLSVFLINITFTNNNSRPLESKNLPKSNSLSNEYDFDWYKDWGSTYNDYGTDVAVDSNGFIYVCGYTNTTGSENYDMVLIKYNKSGVEQWARTWGGPDDDTADCLVLDNSSNIYIAGYTKNAGDSDGDLCVVKFDSSGNYLTNVTWGGDEFDEARGIVIDSFGNIYVGGNTQSYGDLDGDSVLILFNSSLSLLWNSTWGGDLADVTQDVELDSEDYIYVVGHSDSMDPDVDEYDNYILKYDSYGVLQWAEDWDASWTQRGMNLAIDSNDNLYLIGYTFGHPAGSMKGLLLKYDKDGNYQWYKTFGSDGVYGDSWRAITILPNDDIYIGGYTITHDISTNGDSILLNYDPSGNLIWHRAWGNTGTEGLFGLTYDSELNIYCAGSSSSVGSGEYDIIALKYRRKISDYPFEIISPENVVYDEAMMGYYLGTYGFECDEDGSDPNNWTVSEVDGTVNVVDSYANHNKVVEFHDIGSNRVGMTNLISQSSGIIEFWVYSTLVSADYSVCMFVYDGFQHGISLYIYDGYFLYYDGGFNSVYSASADTWYHVKLKFDIDSSGDGTNDWHLWVDGVSVDRGYGYSFRGDPSEMDNVWIASGNNPHDYRFYIDALSYSWDPSYNPGDNLNEGLLVSYNTEVNLSWIGYSLDGGSNITITGNKVIPLPENGVHSIVLSAITSSLGTHIKAGPRIFIIDIHNPPSMPILPDFLPLSPIILTSIGIGIVALLGIILIVYRRRIFGRTGPIIVPEQEILVDERIDSGRDQFKFCPFCGKSIKNTHNFCVNCGASLKNI